MLRQQRLLSGSLQFDFLSRIVCAKNTWKSSATATKEIPKGELSFVTRNSTRFFVSKAKHVIDRICLVEKLKSFMAATKCFHLTTASSNER